MSSSATSVMDTTKQARAQRILELRRELDLLEAEERLEEIGPRIATLEHVEAQRRAARVFDDVIEASELALLRRERSELMRRVKSEKRVPRRVVHRRAPGEEATEFAPVEPEGWELRYTIEIKKDETPEAPTPHDDEQWNLTIQLWSKSRPTVSEGNIIMNAALRYLDQVKADRVGGLRYAIDELEPAQPRGRAPLSKEGRGYANVIPEGPTIFWTYDWRRPVTPPAFSQGEMSISYQFTNVTKGRSSKLITTIVKYNEIGISENPSWLAGEWP